MSSFNGFLRFYCICIKLTYSMFIWFIKSWEGWEELKTHSRYSQLSEKQDKSRKLILTRFETFGVNLIKQKSSKMSSLQKFWNFFKSDNFCKERVISYFDWVIKFENPILISCVLCAVVEHFSKIWINFDEYCK